MAAALLGIRATLRGIEDLDMAHFTQIELANWMALYIGTGICCAIALVLSCAATVHDLYRERSWTSLTSVRGALLFVPKTWWRWQKYYLASTPVTLGVVGLFAVSMSWG